MDGVLRIIYSRVPVLFAEASTWPRLHPGSSGPVKLKMERDCNDGGGEVQVSVNGLDDPTHLGSTVVFTDAPNWTLKAPQGSASVLGLWFMIRMAGAKAFQKKVRNTCCPLPSKSLISFYPLRVSEEKLQFCAGLSCQKPL